MDFLKKEFRNISSPLERAKKKLNLYTDLLKKHGDIIRKDPEAYAMLNKRLNRYSTFVKKATNAQEKQKHSLTKLFGTAIKWASVFTIVYRVLRGGMNTMSSLIRFHYDLELSIARVLTVTRSHLRETGRRIAIENTINNAVAKFAKTHKEAAESMYFLGSAGLNLKENIAALQPVLKLSLATFGDVAQTTKLVAGIYNVFGNQIKNTTSLYEKFNIISSVIASVYRRHQIELSEVSSGMQFVASAAGLVDFNFRDLITTLGFLHSSDSKKE